MSRRALLVVAAVFVAYLVAVLQRSSLGVAAVEATQRFDIAATTLSMLAVAQLAVYAALQIPVGMLIDRVGPRAPLLAGAALMATGQAVVALAGSPEVAILGRMLVGAGDAGTFAAGIRLFVTWVPAPRVPFVTQLFGGFGQLGQLLSAIPFMVLLHATGWTIAFLSIASLSVVALVAVLGATVASAPAGERPPPPTARETLRHFTEAVRRPGTWIGFWAHFSSQCAQTTFALLWGFPFLTVGVGLAPAEATTLLSLTVVVAFVTGPLLGIVSARFPLRRSDLVLGIVGMMGIAWALVLAWPGVPPTWLLLVLIAALGVCGPGSMIGFDYARTYNPMRQLGSANGIVNTGGFIASFVAMFLIGVVLDALHGGAPLEVLYSLDSFRVAFLVQYAVIGLGVVMLLVTRRGIRRRMRDEEGIVVAPLWLSLVRRIRPRGPGPDGSGPQTGVR